MNAATRAVSISAAAALLLTAVWFFWPARLGGGATYVTTHGISMEPGFHTGDLAVLRSSGSYAVGDVVGYYSPSLDTIVMHRIVDTDGDRFVIQGDNNTWLDQDRPTAEELIGSLFLRIPHGGKALNALRSPGALVLVLSAALGALSSSRRPRGRHAARRRRAPTTSLPAFSMPVRARARQVALGSGAVALLAAVGSGALLLVPSTQTLTETVQVDQRGQFTYTGSAAPGTTYPTGVVSTGDTVWTKLATGLTVSYAHSLSGSELADVHGVLRLDVSVAAADGWSAYLTSSSVVDLENGAGTASVAVDAAGAAALLNRHYTEIGTSGGGATLRVTPQIATTGTVRGASFSAGSPAPLEFALDATSMRLAGDATTALAPTSQTPVSVETVGDRRFPVLGVEIPIGIARLAAGAVLVVSLVTLAAGAWIGRSDRGDVADGFAVRHAGRILPVTSFDPGPTVIEVSDAEALHRVAERFDTLVLHHAGPDGDVFAVRDLDATYRFVVPNVGGREVRSTPPVPALAPARSAAAGALRSRFA